MPKLGNHVHIYIFCASFFKRFFGREAQGLIKYRSFLNRSMWPKDGMLTGTTTMGHSEPGSNGNEGVTQHSLLSHHQMQFSVRTKKLHFFSFLEGLIPLQGIQSVY